MPYYVFFIPFSIWYCETCHGKEAECVCETLSAWLVLFWSVAHSGWYGHQICCDGVTLCTSSCVGCWYFGLQCIALLVFCTETLQRILISLGAQGAVPSLCVCCHGQWVPAGDMARRLAQHCHPPSSSVYVPIFMTLLLRFSFGGKTLASIWGAGARVVIPSRPFASLSLPPNTAYWLECSVWMWNKVLLFYIKNILIFHSLILHSLFDALRLDATRFTFPQCERVWARSLCVPIRFPKISSWLSGQKAQMTFRKRLPIQCVCCIWLSHTFHRFLKVLSTHY